MDQDARGRWGWRRIGLVAAAPAVLAGGLAFSLLGQPGPEDVVEAYADTIREGDCEGFAGGYRTDDPRELAGKLDICRRGDAGLELVDFRVTQVDESPSGLAVPEGATEVARVGYEAEAAAAGATARYDGAFLVARFDGEWKIVDDDA